MNSNFWCLNELRPWSVSKNVRQPLVRKHGRLDYEMFEPRRLLAATTAIQDGIWNDPNTWDAGVPNSSVRAIIAAGQTVTLTGIDHAAMEIVVQGTLDVAESPGTTKTLTADWIHVNSGGVFQIGTEANRYDANEFVVTLTGDDPDASFTIEGVAAPVNSNNAFLMAAGGGSFQFFWQRQTELHEACCDS